MIGTHPDISYAVTHLSQFSTNPSEDHYKAALHVCRYLVGTQDYKLVYLNKSDKGLCAYTDSDWAADKIRRRSVTGYFFKLAGGVISWRSHAQKTVALSSTEAEYMAISDCSKQAIWIKALLSEIRIQLKSVLIYGDNQSSIFIASNPVLSGDTSANLPFPRNIPTIILRTYSVPTTLHTFPHTVENLVSPEHLHLC